MITITLPGMLGDNVYKIPITHRIAKDHQESVRLLLDRPSSILGDLLSRESWVESVQYSDGVTNYGLGGQPWDFGLGDGEEYIHLGYRRFPINHFTVESMLQAKLPITEDWYRYTARHACISNLHKQSITQLLIHVGSSVDQKSAGATQAILQIAPLILRTIRKLPITIVTNGTNPNTVEELQRTLHGTTFESPKDLRVLLELMRSSVLICADSFTAALAWLIDSPHVRIVVPDAVPQYYESKFRFVEPGNRSNEQACWQSRPASIITAVQTLLRKPLRG